MASGSLRVRVYAGVDVVTGRDLYLKQTVPAGPDAFAEALRVQKELAAQVWEGRHPKTSASVQVLIERHLAMSTMERRGRESLQGYLRKHIAPVIGDRPIGSVNAELLDSFYAKLRRCSAANRPLPRFERIVGYLSHGLALRLDVSDGPFEAALNRTRQACAAALDHHELPYAEVVRVVWPEEYARTPDYGSAYFDVVGPGPSTLRLPGVDVTMTPAPPRECAPGINVFVGDLGFGGPLRLTMVHTPLSVSHPLAEEFLRSWVGLLDVLVSRPAATVEELAAAAVPSRVGTPQR